MIREQIREIRKRKNLTLTELAERAETTTARICKIENGNCNPTLDLLERIANELGYEIVLKRKKY